MTVRSFRQCGLKRMYERDEKRRIPAEFHERAKAILALLVQADTPNALAAPTCRRHPLKGRPDCWSMRISGNWRVVLKPTMST